MIIERASVLLQSYKRNEIMTTLLLSIDEAAKALSIGKTKLYSELSLGHIAAIKIGKRSLITRESLDNYIANLETYPSKQNKEG